MSAILNAAPKAILQGVKDESGGILPVVPEQILPTCRIFFCSQKRGR